MRTSSRSKEILYRRRRRVGRGSITEDAVCTNHCLRRRPRLSRRKNENDATRKGRETAYARAAEGRKLPRRGAPDNRYPPLLRPLRADGALPSRFRALLQGIRLHMAIEHVYLRSSAHSSAKNYSSDNNSPKSTRSKEF